MPLFNILKFFMKLTIARKMKKLAKDKEFQKAVKDMQYHSKREKELIKEYDEKGINIDPRLR